MKSLEKGYKTAIILLLDGVHVGLQGAVEDLDIGEPFLPVKDMLGVYLDGGGQLMNCGSCWKHDHLPDRECLSGTTFISADMVIDHVRATGEVTPSGWQPGKPTLTQGPALAGKVWKVWKPEMAFD